MIASFHRDTTRMISDKRRLHSLRHTVLEKPVLNNSQIRKDNGISKEIDQLKPTYLNSKFSNFQYLENNFRSGREFDIKIVRVTKLESLNSSCS